MSFRGGDGFDGGMVMSSSYRSWALPEHHHRDGRAHQAVQEPGRRRPRYPSWTRNTCGVDAATTSSGANSVRLAEVSAWVTTASRQRGVGACGCVLVAG